MSFLYHRCARPLLFKGDPETVHHLVMAALDRTPQGFLTSRFGVVAPPELAVQVAGLHFTHPIGLAAGFDKNGEHLAALACCGFSHIEVGTVTLEPQPGNEKPRIFRFPQHQALVNRMGFPSKGSRRTRENLDHFLHAHSSGKIVVGINLGKNKSTPLDQAAGEYAELFQRMAPVSAYAVINVSSPNTPGLRELQDKQFLAAIVAAIQSVNTLRVPLFVKIAPDLTPEAIDEVLEVMLAGNLAGIIATNTTISRQGTPEAASVTGGLSGRPLHPLALTTVRYIARQLQAIATPSNSPMPAIIGVGGITTAQDVVSMLRAGASLVQVYTGFIYEGPSLARTLVEGLASYLARVGCSSVTEIIGAEVG